MKNGILPIIFALFAAYFYAKDYSNSTMMADFMMNLWKKEKNLHHQKSILVYFTFKIF